MNRVFAGQPALGQIKQIPVLGKGFWVILTLFAALLVLVVLFSGGSAASEAPALLPHVDTEAVMTGYRSFLDKLANLPAWVAGIFMGASLLVLLDKFFSSRGHAVL